MFLAHEDESFNVFFKFCKRVQNEKEVCITSIKSDHGGELKNENGILLNFSTPRTPKHNGVVERKNKSLQDMSKTMLNDNYTPKQLWDEAANTAYYLQNKIYIRPMLKKTSYEL